MSGLLGGEGQRQSREEEAEEGNGGEGCYSQVTTMRPRILAPSDTRSTSSERNRTR